MANGHAGIEEPRSIIVAIAVIEVPHCNIVAARKAVLRVAYADSGEGRQDDRENYGLQPLAETKHGVPLGYAIRVEQHSTGEPAATVKPAVQEMQRP